MKKLLTLSLCALFCIPAPAQSPVTSIALEASKIIKAAPSRLRHLTVYNSSSSLQYILIFDSATLPAEGSTAFAYVPIPVSAKTIIDIPFETPLVMQRGIVVCNSSTDTSKTIGAADCRFHAIWLPPQ